MTPPPFGPAGPPGDGTLAQPEKARETSQDLSAPTGVEQHPSAPAIPGYILTHPLGQGAFAQVWKAWQVRTRKTVAVKVFTQRQGLDWVFLRREVERLVKLDRHPNIVSLLDADLEAEPGFYVMDLLEEGSLAGFVDAGTPVEPQRAATWMEAVAGALAYVHGKGLIHCDLKPANILLDEEGRPRVADFGQSRVADDAGALGTLFYMAPEQAVGLEEGAAPHPDVRWDVFALGATMFAVLSGKVPFAERRQELEGPAGLAERLKAYRRLVAESPLPDLAELTRGAVDRDLAAIVARCAAVDPERRYASAAEVLEDLRARRGGFPVSPLKGDRLYRAQRFLRRNTAAVAVGSVLALGLAGAFGNIVVKGRAIAAAGVELAAKNREMRGELANSYLIRARQAADKGDEAAAASYFAKSDALAPGDAARWGAQAYLADLARPTRVWDAGGPVASVSLSPDGDRALAGSLKGTWFLPREGEARKLPTAKDENTYPDDRVAFNADGSRAVAYGSKAVLLDGKDGRILAPLEGDGAVFSRDGRRLATAQSLETYILEGAMEDYRQPASQGLVRVYDPADGKLAGKPIKPDRRRSAAAPELDLSADGSRVLIAVGGAMTVEDSATGAAERAPIALPVAAPEGWARGVLSPDGTRLLAWTAAEARLYDRHSGQALGKAMRHEGTLTAALFTPDGRKVITAGSDGTIRCWSSGGASGAPLGPALRQRGAVNALALSADGRVLVSGGQDGTARVWSVEPWGPLGRVLAQGSPVTAVAVSKDGTVVLTGSRDGTVRLWDGAADPAGAARFAEPLPEAFFSPDASRMLAYGHDGARRLVELPSGRTVGLEKRGHPDRTYVTWLARFDAAGKLLLAVDGGAREAQLFDAGTGRLLREFRHERLPGSKGEASGAVDVAEISPDGNYVLTAGQYEHFALWDAGTGKRLYLGNLTDPNDNVTGAAFSPDGGRLALSRAGVFSVWPVGSPQDPQGKPDYPHAYENLRWSGDGRRVISHYLKEASLLDPAAGTPLAHVVHEEDVTQALLSPDGALALVAGLDGRLEFLETGKGRPVAEPARDLGPLRAAVFSPDGRVAATGGDEGLVRFWDPRTGQEVGRPLWQGGPVHALAFTPDGRWLYAVGGGSTQRWDVSWLAASESPAQLSAEAEAASDRRVGADGSLSPIPLSEWMRIGSKSSGLR